MKKIAILLADGFEEIEALVTADILKRANFICDLISIDEQLVTGGHNIIVKCDKTISDDIKNYDMLIIPGGMEGVNNLKNNKQVLLLIEYFFQHQKYIASICAGPIVIATAKVAENSKITAYPSDDVYQKLTNYQLSDQKVVIDNKLITANAAGSVFEFAFCLVNILNGDNQAIKDAICFN